MKPYHRNDLGSRVVPRLQLANQNAEVHRLVLRGSVEIYERNVRNSEL